MELTENFLCGLNGCLSAEGMAVAYSGMKMEGNVEAQELLVDFSAILSPFSPWLLIHSVLFSFLPLFVFYFLISLS